LRKASLKLILLRDLRGEERLQTPLSIQHSAKPYKITIRAEKNQRIDSKPLNNTSNGRNQGLNGKLVH